MLNGLEADFTSKKKIFGIPLLHISSESAKGIIAIGDKATGLIAVGRFAVGLIAAGSISIGIISAGAISVGLAAAAGAVAVGFGRSAGAVAAGRKAYGAVAFGSKVSGGLKINLCSADKEDAKYSESEENKEEIEQCRENKNWWN